MRRQEQQRQKQEPQEEDEEEEIQQRRWEVLRRGPVEAAGAEERKTRRNQALRWA
jgi:hypothetical protein